MQVKQNDKMKSRMFGRNNLLTNILVSPEGNPENVFKFVKLLNIFKIYLKISSSVLEGTLKKPPHVLELTIFSAAVVRRWLLIYKHLSVLCWNILCEKHLSENLIGKQIVGNLAKHNFWGNRDAASFVIVINQSGPFWEIFF